MNAKTPDNVVADILALYGAGMSSRDVAQALQVSQRTVMKYINKEGINRHVSETNTIDKNVRLASLEAYESGYSANKVAKALGLSKTTVLALARESGLIRTASETKGIKSGTKEYAIQLYATGMSSRKVAENVDVDHGTVLNWVRDAEIARSMSTAAVLRIANEGSRNSRGIRSFFISDKTNQSIRTDSLLELARLIQLNGDTNVKAISRASEKIPYGENKHYIADLKVYYYNDTIAIEEVKPAYCLLDESVLRKERAAIQFYTSVNIQYRIITEYEIGQSNFDLIDPSSFQHIKDEQARVARALNAIRYGLKKPKQSRISSARLYN